MTTTVAQQRILDCRPSITGKVAFVTGGLGGIGRATVAALAEHGAYVAFSYAERRDTREAADQLIAQYPGQLSAHALDLRSADSIRRCLGEALERWQDLHILVNNAAVGSATVAAYADSPSEQDSAMLMINADGTLKVCQIFLELLHDSLTTVQRKIINISSVGGGMQIFPGFRLSDGMSKAAVAFLTRQLAAEAVHTLVDIFALCPGATNTAMFQASTLNQLTDAEHQAFTAALPKGRLIEPEEIATIILFLASAYSTPLHGAVIDSSMGLGVRPGMLSERPH